MNTEDISLYVIRSDLTDMVRVGVYSKRDKKIVEDCFGCNTTINKMSLKGVPTELATKLIHEYILKNDLDSSSFSIMSDPYATLHLSKEETETLTSKLFDSLKEAIDEYNEN